jgi:arylsulfatase A-like enzyme
VLLAAIGAGGCRRAQHEARPVPVILISIDTLREDHVGCFGYPRPTTPNLDATLCKDGVVFEQAISQAPSTLPSHASMLTGLLPVHHGASFAKKHALPPEVTTLAERLSAAGYRTASFNNGGQIRASWGLSQGFEVYRSLTNDHLKPVAAEALDWLDGVLAEGERRRIFLFLHTYEVHHPYTPSEKDLAVFERSPYRGYLGRSVGYKDLQRINSGGAPLSSRDLEFIIDAYDAEIRSMDRALGTLLEALKQRGLYRDALILFTSDHGEEFHEHGWVGWHSHTLYDELLRVPLVVKLPGDRAAARRIGYQVRLTDLVPTVLDVLGMPEPEHLDGTSLLPLIDGPPGGRRLAVSQRDNQRSSSIRSGDWKLWDQRLFNLDSDPGETLDVSAQYPDVENALRARLDQALEDAAEGADVELSKEEVERLKSLGYL